MIIEDCELGMWSWPVNKWRGENIEGLKKVLELVVIIENNASIWLKAVFLCCHV